MDQLRQYYMVYDHISKEERIVTRWMVWKIKTKGMEKFRFWNCMKQYINTISPTFGRIYHKYHNKQSDYNWKNHRIFKIQQKNIGFLYFKYFVFIPYTCMYMGTIFNNRISIAITISRLVSFFFIHPLFLFCVHFV